MVLEATSRPPRLKVTDLNMLSHSAEWHCFWLHPRVIRCNNSFAKTPRCQSLPVSGSSRQSTLDRVGKKGFEPSISLEPWFLRPRCIPVPSLPQNILSIGQFILTDKFVLFILHRAVSVLLTFLDACKPVCSTDFLYSSYSFCYAPLLR